MNSGLISKIQRYSTKDGPGLRSTAFLVGCNMKCVWCSNPELIGEGVKILHHPQLCVHCGACTALSGGAITFGEEGCMIDRERCGNLAECAAACYYDAYETVGYTVSPEELADWLSRDKAFYDMSGGGVTFSGGEPALQAEFVIETARILRRSGIRVAVDTAGSVPWERLGPLAFEADLILYDIKAFDANIHLTCTGEDNRIILENAQKLAEAGKDMIIRMIVAPGYNDQREDIKARRSFAAALGPCVRKVEVLKLHHLGESKYRSLGITYPLKKADTKSGPDEIA